MKMKLKLRVGGDRVRARRLKVAEEIYKTRVFAFSLERRGESSEIGIACTTEKAAELTLDLDDVAINVITLDPEFLGWTVEDIAEHVE